jgi:hypothetical protein
MSPVRVRFPAPNEIDQGRSRGPFSFPHDPKNQKGRDHSRPFMFLRLIDVYGVVTVTSSMNVLLPYWLMPRKPSCTVVPLYAVMSMVCCFQPVDPS